MDPPLSETPPTPTPFFFGPMDSPSPTVSTLDADFAELEDLLGMIQTMQNDLSNVIDQQQSRRQTSIEPQEVVSSFRQSFLNPCGEEPRLESQAQNVHDDSTLSATTEHSTAHKAEDLDTLLMQITNHHRFEQPEPPTPPTPLANCIYSDPDLPPLPPPLLSATSGPVARHIIAQGHEISPIREIPLDFQDQDDCFPPPPPPDMFGSDSCDLTCEPLSVDTPPPPPLHQYQQPAVQQHMDPPGHNAAAMTSPGAASSIDSGIQSVDGSGAGAISEPREPREPCEPRVTSICSTASSSSLASGGATSISGHVVPHHYHHMLPQLQLHPPLSSCTAPSPESRRHSSSSSTASCNTSEDTDPDRTSWKFSDEMRAKAERVENLLKSTTLNKLVARVHRPDRTTKAIMVDEETCVGHLCGVLASKNHEPARIEHTLVEKLPDMKMERIIEDHENLVDTLRSWPDQCKNLLFFEDKADKFGSFIRPELYLPGVSAKEDEFHEKFCDRIIRTVFDEQHIELPAIRDSLYIKKPGHKQWIRRLCTVRRSGLYASKKSRFSSTLTDMACVTPFHDYLRLYVTTGGWCKDKKVKAPTPFGFALKPLHVQRRESAQVLYFCAADESSLKRWIAIVRIAQHGHQLLRNFRSAQERTRDSPPRNGAVDVRKMTGPLQRACQTLPRRGKSLRVDGCDGDNTSLNSASSESINDGSADSSPRSIRAKHNRNVREPALPIDTTNAQQLVTAFANRCTTDGNYHEVVSVTHSNQT